MSSFEETNPPLKENNEENNEQNNEQNNVQNNEKLNNKEPECFDTYVVSHPLKYYDKFDDKEIGINDDILRGIYSYGYERPSPIQRIAIKPLIEGRDIVIQSHSGTGKTGTFSIGMLNRIDQELKSPQAIVICNTRELADQTSKVVKILSQFTKISHKLCIGGDMQNKFMPNNVNEHVIIGTPGRLCDLIQKGYIKNEHLKMLIVDEADDVLSVGFRKQVKRIFTALPKEGQVILVSATIPQDMESLFEIILKPDFTSILIKDDQITLDGIDQYYIDLDEQYKFDAIIDIYQYINVGQGIIYCNTKTKADELKNILGQKDFSVDVLHGDMMQKERETIMNNFRSGVVRILITTDILARGIDVQQVSLVINYDMPKYPQTYIHRIGRSGRYGRRGVALNFCTRKEKNILKYIQTMYSTEIKPFPEDVTAILNTF
jgi:superfamily II DNA/RNA helicase